MNVTMNLHRAHIEPTWDLCRSHVGCIWVSHMEPVCNHIGPIWVLYALLAGEVPMGLFVPQVLYSPPAAWLHSSTSQMLPSNKSPVRRYCFSFRSFFFNMGYPIYYSHLPRYHSNSQLFANINVPVFQAVIGNLIFAFITRLVKSANVIIQGLMKLGEWSQIYLWHMEALVQAAVCRTAFW